MKAAVAAAVVALLLMAGGCVMVIGATTAATLAPIAAAVKMVADIPAVPVIADFLGIIDSDDLDRVREEMDKDPKAKEALTCILPPSVTVPATTAARTTAPSSRSSTPRSTTTTRRAAPTTENTPTGDTLAPGTLLVDSGGEVTKIAGEVADRIPNGTPYAKAEAFLLSAFTGGPTRWSTSQTTTRDTSLPEPSEGVERVVSLLLFTMQESGHVTGGGSAFQDIVKGC